MVKWLCSPQAVKSTAIVMFTVTAAITIISVQYSVAKYCFNLVRKREGLIKDFHFSFKNSTFYQSADLLQSKDITKGSLHSSFVATFFLSTIIHFIHNYII